MPTVKGKKFPYTKAGKTAAAKARKMNMGGMAKPMGGRQNLANEETNRPNAGRDTTNYQYRNAAPSNSRGMPSSPPPGMKKGGSVIKNKNSGLYGRK